MRSMLWEECLSFVVQISAMNKIIIDATEKEDTTSSNSVDGGSVLKDAVEYGFLFEHDDIENREEVTNNGKFQHSHPSLRDREHPHVLKVKFLGRLQQWL